jgi:archaellum component FlaF (FlaF/FlaG flagellin family)
MSMMSDRPFRVERVSVSSSGREGDGPSYQSDISGDGRFVTFTTLATNLAPGDANNTEDIYVHDRIKNVTERVSSTASGEAGDSASTAPAISADGRFVTYYSFATNLAPGDTDNNRDIYVYDRKKDATALASVSSDGEKGNGQSVAPDISASGRYVAYDSDSTNLVPDDDNGASDIFVHDRRTDTTEIVSIASNGDAANDFSFNASISANGRYVSFLSFASNLVPGDGNGQPDIFVHDRRTGATELVSIASNGEEGEGPSYQHSISASGRYVAFLSEATNLVPNDTNGTADIFVHDRRKGTTERVSIASDGEEANGFSFEPSVSADGRYVTYFSEATNLVTGDDNAATDVFVFDRLTATTRRISVATNGDEANGFSYEPVISDDGQFVSFTSEASNLIPGDNNGWADVFVARTPDWLV